jgi:short-subunit dehydrogenase
MPDAANMSDLVALITGATAGIGAAFARNLAGEGYALILVARDEARLTAFARELSDLHGVPVTPLVADLSTDEGCARVEARLTGADPPVDLLVNNAGSSLNTPFPRSDADSEQRLLRLNVHAVMRLTLAALPGMRRRRRGEVVNVSSVSGFAATMPGSTYPASKAWVTAFSESVALSVRTDRVRVMALCPGFTRTEFHQRAGIDLSKMPTWLWLDADRVVRESLRDLRRGKVVSVPSWRYKVAVAAMRHLPRSWVWRVGGRGSRRMGRVTT